MIRSMGFALWLPGSKPSPTGQEHLFQDKSLNHFPVSSSMFSSVQFSRSVVSDSLRPHESQHTRPPRPSPTPGVHSNSPSIESVMPSSHLILCRPLFLLPPIPSSIRVFPNESTLCMRWPKYWSFSFSISGTLKSLLQHHSSKASILRCSAFF